MFLAPEVNKLGPDLGLKPVRGLGKCVSLINVAAEMYKEKGEIYRPQLYYVKRIIGLAGEKIHFTDNGIKINGAAIRTPKHLMPHLSSSRKTENLGAGKILTRSQRIVFS